jgi:AcrR family transcriptional regulator
LPRPSQRPRLLEAVSRLVLEEGLAELTLERAAEAAGVSKGGLLYHFPTKADLVAALVEDVLDGFEEAVGARSVVDDRPASWGHAYVDVTFDTEVSQPSFAAALLRAPDLDPALLARCAARMEAWQRRLETDGLDPGTAAAVRYACDGWWTLSRLATDDGDLPDDHLRQRLHRLIDEAVR